MANPPLVTPATGGTGISIDTTSGTANGHTGSGAFTSLTSNIIITEPATSTIALGVHTFSLPAGWEFDTSSQVTVGSNAAESGLNYIPQNIIPNTSTFSIRILNVSTDVPAILSFGNIKVRPTGTNPATINGKHIYHSAGTITGVVNGTDGADGADGENFGDLSAVPGAANYLAVTGGATATAGADNELTITAYDQFGNIATGYSGAKNLTFSGLNNSPDSNIPKVETVNFGTPVSVSFTGGVSNASVATLVAYKAETGVSVDVTDGTISSADNVAYDLDLTVNPASAGRLEMIAVTNPIVAGDSSGTELTIYAKDAFGNLDTNYAGGKNLTFSGIANSPAGNVSTVEGNVISSPITVIFASGVTNGTNATLVAYKAEGSVELEVSDGSINSNANAAYDVDLIVRHTTADHLEFSTSVTSPKVAGTQFALPALNVVDIYGNTTNGANGAVAYSQIDTVAYDLSGLDNGPTFGADAFTTPVTFTSGVSTTALNTTLYRAQSTTVTANSASLSGTDVASNSFTVNAAVASAVNITTQPENSSGTVDNALTIQPAVSVTDAYGNVASNGETVTASVVIGTGDALRNTTATTTNGTATFSNLGYNKSGESFTVKFTVGGINSAESFPAVDALNPGAIHHFTVAEITDPVGAGVLTSPTVTAYDQYNNVKTNYVGIVQFTKTDNHAQSLVPANYTFVGGDSGVHTFTNGVKLVTIGEQTVSVGDTVMTSATGAQSAITVTVGPAAKVRVETAANGSGTVVAAQEIVPGNSITVYSITRDEYDNFVINEAADSWSLVGFTGNLAVAGDSKSAVFNAIDPGVGTIHTVEGGLTPVDSGTITVTPLTTVYVATTGNNTTNPGTSGSPKLTIQAGVNVVAASGVVNVYSGTYNESVAVNKIVTIQKETSALTKPIITANNNWGFQLLNASGIIIDGFEIQITAGASTDDAGIQLENADNAVITNNIISTTGDSALGIWACGSSSGCGVSDNVQITKNTITVGGVGTGIYTEYSLPAVSGWVIGGSTSNANTINATAVDNSNPIEFYDASGEISYNNINGRATGGNAITIKTNLSNITGAIKIKNNTINGGGGSGMVYVGATTDYSINSIDNEVSGNTFSNWAVSSGSGLRLTNTLGGTTSGFKVFNNTFTNPSPSNTPSARDDTVASANTWYSDTTGNTWSDFSGNTNYPISYLTSGSALSVDNYPAGKLDAAQSTIGVNPTSGVVADNSAFSTITITAKNSSGAGLTGINIAKFNVTSNGISASTTISAVEEISAGVYTATIKSTAKETKTVSATIGGTAVNGTDVSRSVTFIAGLIDNYVFTSGAIGNQTAGVVFPVSIQARDVNNNLITTEAGATETVNIILGVIDATTTPTSVVTINGAATVNITLTKATSGQTITFTGVTSGKTTGVSNAFNVAAGAVNINSSTLGVDTGTAVANNVAVITATITAKDVYNNLISGVSAVLTSTGTGDTFATNPTLTNGSGVAAITIKSTKAEAKTLGATIGGVTITATQAVTFTAGPATKLTVTATPTSATIAQTSTINIYAQDSFGNTNTSNVNTVVLNSGGDSDLNDLVLTLVGGTAQTTLSKPTVGTATVSVQEQASALTAGQVQVTFTSSDGTGPSVESYSPVDGTTGVSVSAGANPTHGIWIKFSEALNPTSVTSSSLKLRAYIDAATYATTTPANYILQEGNTKVVIEPTSALSYGTKYYLYIDSGVEDAVGNSFTGGWLHANMASHEFTTGTSLVVDSLTLQQGTASGYDQYLKGWIYKFKVTVNNLSENTLELRLADWAQSGGLGSVATNENTRLLFNTTDGSDFAATGLAEAEITGGSGDIHSYAVGSAVDYSGSDSVTITGKDADLVVSGHQLFFYVYVKVPTGTPIGFYGTSYGILTQ